MRSLLMLSAILIEHAAAGQCAPADVFNGHTVPLARTAYAAIADDLDGDGNLDLVVAESSSFSGGAVGVYWGTGDGRGFESPDLRDVPTGSRDVAVADVDGDAILDIVVVGVGPGICVLRGMGSRQFTAPDVVGAHDDGYAIAIGDMNDDAIPDLVVAYPAAADVVHLLPGLGDGTFGNAVLVHASAVTDIDIEDLDGDGHLDLVLTELHDDAVAIRLGAGDGTFGAPTVLPVGDLPVDTVLADLDRDGVADVITANNQDATISVYLGLGTGAFSSFATIGVGDEPHAVAAADLDGDGRPDILVSNSNILIDNEPGHLDVLLGTGAPELLLPPVRSPVGLRPIGVTPGDFDGDGNMDVAVLNPDDFDFSVLRGRGDGTLAANPVSPAESQPMSLDVADVDMDGDPDLVTACFTAQSINILRNDGRGSFAMIDELTVHLPAPAISADMGDVNGDDVADIVVARFVSGEGEGGVRVLIGVGDGTFAFGGLVPTIALEGVTLADLNGDGHLDLIGADPFNDVVQIWVGEGDGTFPGDGQLTSVAGRPISVAVGDVDGDRVPDLVVGHDGNQDYISVMLGHGDGTFEPEVQFDTIDRHPRGLALSDLDGDGDLDIAVAAADLPDHGSACVLLGHGDGTFAPVVRYFARRNTTRIVARDLNRDGTVDLAVTNTNSFDVTVFYGRGDGTFDERERYVVGYEPTWIVTDDLDLDGIADLAITSDRGGRLYLLFGQCAGSTCDADLDGDGTVAVPDLLEVLAGWGTPDADVTGDGTTDVADLLAVLSAWGACA